MKHKQETKVLQSITKFCENGNENRAKASEGFLPRLKSMVLKKSTSLISGTVFFSSVTLKRTFRRERGGHGFVPLSDEDFKIESNDVPSVVYIPSKYM